MRNSYIAKRKLSCDAPLIVEKGRRHMANHAHRQGSVHNESICSFMYAMLCRDHRYPSEQNKRRKKRRAANMADHARNIRLLSILSSHWIEGKRREPFSVRM